ncbi:MAG: glutathione S-transferase [Synechococcus sp. MED-G71]|nr:MAG: glutathione S-transferase [Synechococcus sp. MED-G71]|tara:strand:+ start:65 stop:1285 length:1221 start_codon:yes stop_codon:yes gene_type:complete
MPDSSQISLHPEALAPLSWDQLKALTPSEPDRVEGPTNSQARLRLFGAAESAVRVVLYRDHHAWCPYCQKVWLWLEERRIPYRIEKVTMFCYGEKEPWYKRLVPSGMLPALAIDGQVITESDRILLALEQCFGPLGASLEDERVVSLRRLERDLFGAWCTWLCYPGAESQGAALFHAQAARVAQALERHPGPWFLEEFSSADLIFVPYVERMNSSLLYYKGYELRQQWPALDRWFAALDQRSTYRGTRSDHHTHAHDLPPQMGGCYSNRTAAAQHWAKRIDQGPWQGLSDCTDQTVPDGAAAEALARVLRHWPVLQQQHQLDEQAMRCVLTRLMNGRTCQPPRGSERSLRSLRDRISVPRDMGVHAARLLRQALEETAALAGEAQGPAIPMRHRRDQDPAPFLRRR